MVEDTLDHVVRHCLCRMWRLAPVALRSARMFNLRATALARLRGRFGSSYTPVRRATSDFRPSFRACRTARIGRIAGSGAGWPRGG